MDLNAIKAATWHLHVRAERGGIIADILTGRATRFGLALLLRNLLPVYRVLDGSFYGGPPLARSEAIEADLRHLSPGDVPPLLPEGAAYAARVTSLASYNVGELLAHAYVRYLGDLNGGRILRDRVHRCIGEAATELLFHDHIGIDDISQFATSYRCRLENDIPPAGFERVAREVPIAFALNIALSEAVHRHALAKLGDRPS